MKSDSTCPYETLYIYEIRGIISCPYDRFQTDFMGAWEEDGEYTFLFFTSRHEQSVKEVVAALGLEYRSETVMPYAQWEAGDKIRPMVVRQFFIYPNWLEREVPENLIPIVLDPSVAFGSGYHPTTRCCLELLSDLSAQEQMPKRVLDLGSGTGILAIAAAKSGAEEVLAIELNNLSAQIANRNVALNQLSDRVRVLQARAQESVSASWDLIIANLTYPVIRELIVSPFLRTAPSALISGLHVSELERLIPRLNEIGFEISQQKQEDSWMTVLLTKRG